MANSGQGFDRDEFADTTEFPESTSSTAQYGPDWPFGLHPEAEDDIAQPHGRHRTGQLPTGALAAGAMMAIVPFAVAVALFLGRCRR